VLALEQTNDIGVSYPQHVAQPLARRTLGNVLRLHAAPEALERLLVLDWLRGMRDHTQVGALRSVPAGAQHRTVQRRQFKTSVERLRRRRMKRKGETAEQASVAIPSDIEQRPDLPFVQLRSSSTGQFFCLCIEHGPLLANPVHGAFNAYGLGQVATVPWF
jgi:CRISPR-associated endonuclease Csy4